MEAAIVRGRSSSWEVESGIPLLFSESVVGGLGDGDDILVFCRVGGWTGREEEWCTKSVVFG
jgi:hypothetical protein